MDDSPSHRIKAGLGSHLHQVVAVEQSTGDQLFIAQYFAVAHLRRQIAVGGGSHPQLFGADPADQLLTFQGAQCIR